jgi:hypothetical protein
LRVRANAHITSDYGATLACSVASYGYKLTANWHTDNRAAGAHRVVCYRCKSIANHGATFAYCVACYGYRLAANWHTDNHAAGAHRVVCYRYKSIANHGATDGGS